MAAVVRVGKRFCVAHSITKVVIKRQGKPVCFATRAKAVTEANRTQCKVIGGPACKLVK